MSAALSAEPKPDWRAQGIGSGEPGPGRDPLYTPELGRQICHLVAEGKTVQQICALDGMPSYRTIHRWRNEVPVFGTEYARAREESAEYLENEAIQAARDAATKDEAYRVSIRFDTIKWATSKRNPEVYGEKTTTDVRFSGTVTIEADTSDRDALLAELQRRLGIAAAPPQIEGKAEPVPEDSGGA